MRMPVAVMLSLGPEWRSRLRWFLNGGFRVIKMSLPNGALDGGCDVSADPSCVFLPSVPATASSGPLSPFVARGDGSAGETNKGNAAVVGRCCVIFSGVRE